MRSKVLLIFFLVSTVKQIKCSPKNDSPGSNNDVGSPLFLTPFIESGDIEAAKEKSRVRLDTILELKSFSGFITVNKTYNSNLFFWFFKSKVPKAPLLIWLQGGPGSSSLLALFVENGPIIVKRNLSTKLREYSWTNEFSMLYIDNPVGTGFSFTENDNGYARDQDDVARDMYEFLQQFFTLFSEMRSSDLYLTGQSYAGKFIPSIGYKIHTEKNPNITLKGISIGNGVCDPINQLDYGTYWYQLGLIDERQQSYLFDKQNETIKLIKENKFVEASAMRKHIFECFKNFTGLSFSFNYLMGKRPKAYDYFKKYLKLPYVRRALHVGSVKFKSRKIVDGYMQNDFMQSVKPKLAVLMDNYKVLLYSGQLDPRDPYPHTANFLRTVQWKYREEYLTADRYFWRVTPKEEVAGYVKRVHDFYFVVVRNGGHILPYDQPRAAYDLIKRFVNNNL